MSFFFFFNDPATTEIYTLSLHDALPISALARVRTDLLSHVEGVARHGVLSDEFQRADRPNLEQLCSRQRHHRSEEHTSELQSPCNLVCRLLLEKKKKIIVHLYTNPRR